jgi:hypothetical protein
LACPFRTEEGKNASAPLVDEKLEYSKGGRIPLPPLPIVHDVMLHTLYGRSLAFDTTLLNTFAWIYHERRGAWH